MWQAPNCSACCCLLCVCDCVSSWKTCCWVNDSFFFLCLKWKWGPDLNKWSTTLWKSVLVCDSLQLLYSVKDLLLWVLDNILLKTFPAQGGAVISLVFPKSPWWFWSRSFRDEKKIQQKCLLLLLLLNTLKAFTNMYSLLMIFNCTLVCSKTQRSIVLLYLMQQARIFLLWIKDLKNKKQWENTNTLTWFNQLTLLRSVNTGQCAK